MPFGAIASVYAFLRTALLLNRIASELLYIPLTSYFDDFVVISKKEIAMSTGDCFSMMMKILGFALSASDKKNKPFSQVLMNWGYPSSSQSPSKESSRLPIRRRGRPI